MPGTNASWFFGGPEVRDFYSQLLVADTVSLPAFMVGASSVGSVNQVGSNAQLPAVSATVTPSAISATATVFSPVEIDTSVIGTIAATATVQSPVLSIPKTVFPSQISAVGLVKGAALAGQTWSESTTSDNTPKQSTQLSDGTLIYLRRTSATNMELRYSSDHQTTNLISNITLGTTSTVFSSLFTATFGLCADANNNIYVTGPNGSGATTRIIQAFTKNAGYSWTAQSAGSATGGLINTSAHTWSVWCDTGGGTNNAGHILVINDSSISYSIWDAGAALAGTATLTATADSPAFLTGRTNISMFLAADGFGATSGISCGAGASSSFCFVGAWAVDNTGTLSTNTNINSSLSGMKSGLGYPSPFPVNVASNVFAIVDYTTGSAGNGTLSVARFSKTAQLTAPTTKVLSDNAIFDTSNSTMSVGVLVDTANQRLKLIYRDNTTGTTVRQMGVDVSSGITFDASSSILDTSVGSANTDVVVSNIQRIRQQIQDIIWENSGLTTVYNEAYNPNTDVPTIKATSIPTNISATGIVQSPVEIDKPLPVNISAVGTVQSPTLITTPTPSNIAATAVVKGYASPVSTPFAVETWSESLTTNGFPRQIIHLSNGTLVYLKRVSTSVTELRYSSDHISTDLIANLATGTTSTTFTNSTSIPLGLSRDADDNIYVIGPTGDAVTSRWRVEAFAKNTGYSWTSGGAVTVTTSNAPRANGNSWMTWCNTGGGTNSKGHLLIVNANSSLVGTFYGIFDAGDALNGTGTLTDNAGNAAFTGGVTTTYAFPMYLAADGFGASSGICIGAIAGGNTAVGAWAINSSGVLSTNTSITTTLSGMRNSSASTAFPVWISNNVFALVGVTTLTVNAGVLAVSRYSKTAQLTAPTTKSLTNNAVFTTSTSKLTVGVVTDIANKQLLALYRDSTTGTTVNRIGVNVSSGITWDSSASTLNTGVGSASTDTILSNLQEVQGPQDLFWTDSGALTIYDDVTYLTDPDVIVVKSISLPSNISAVATFGVPDLGQATVVTPTNIVAIGTVQTSVEIATAVPSNIAAVGTVQAPLEIDKSLPANISATGTVQAPILVLTSLPSNIAAIGTVQTPIEIDKPLPANIAAIGTVQTPSIISSSTVTPTNIAAVGTVQGSTLIDVSLPNQISAIGTVQSPIINALAKPTQIAAIGTVQAPIELEAGLPANISAIGTVQNPIGVAKVLPTNISAVGTVQTSTITTATVIVPSVISATGTVQSPVLIAKALPSNIAAIGLVQAPAATDVPNIGQISAVGTVQSPLLKSIAIPTQIAVTATIATPDEFITEFAPAISATATVFTPLVGSYTTSSPDVISAKATVSGPFLPFLIGSSSVGDNSQVGAGGNINTIIVVSKPNRILATATVTMPDSIMRVGSINATATTFSPLLKEIAFPSTISVSGVVQAPAPTDVKIVGFISVIGTVQAPKILESATPTNIAVIGTVQAPIGKEIEFPTRILAIGTVQAPIANSVATPANIARAATINAPVITASALVTPTNILATGTVQSSLETVREFATFISAVGTIQSPTPIAKPVITHIAATAVVQGPAKFEAAQPGTILAHATINAPIIKASSKVTPNNIAATGIIQSPIPTDTKLPASIAVRASIYAPSLIISSTAILTAIQVTGLVQTPALKEITKPTYINAVGIIQAPVLASIATPANIVAVGTVKSPLQKEVGLPTNISAIATIQSPIPAVITKPSVIARTATVNGIRIIEAGTPAAIQATAIIQSNTYIIKTFPGRILATATTNIPTITATALVTPNNIFVVGTVKAPAFKEISLPARILATATVQSPVLAEIAKPNRILATATTIAPKIIEKVLPLNIAAIATVQSPLEAEIKIPSAITAHATTFVPKIVERAEPSTIQAVAIIQAPIELERAKTSVIVAIATIGAPIKHAVSTPDTITATATVGSPRETLVAPQVAITATANVFAPLLSISETSKPNTIQASASITTPTEVIKPTPGAISATAIVVSGFTVVEIVPMGGISAVAVVNVPIMYQDDLVVDGLSIVSPVTMGVTHITASADMYPETTMAVATIDRPYVFEKHYLLSGNEHSHRTEVKNTTKEARSSLNKTTRKNPDIRVESRYNKKS